MLLDQQRAFVGCNADCELLAAAETKVLLAITSLMLNTSFDNTGSREVEATAKVFKEEIAALLAYKNASV